MHEAQYHDATSFLTLTYSDENLPHGGTLVPDHFIKFMKRLRKSIPTKIRFYHVGEYGDKLSRPHYHAVIFGHSFPDKKFAKKSNDGEHDIFTSAALDTLWGFGNCWVGSVTIKSAQYCASYILKKIGGDQAEEHYRRVIQDTGEVIQLHPEYTTMSRMPGIGQKWFEEFHSDAFPSDFVIMDGKKSGVPKYYATKLKKRDRDQFDDIKRSRRKKTLEREFIRHQSPARLSVREEVTKARKSLYKRNLE